LNSGGNKSLERPYSKLAESILDFNWEVDKVLTFEQLKSNSPKKNKKIILITYSKYLQKLPVTAGLGQIGEFNEL
jgi:hypothetical protein